MFYSYIYILRQEFINKMLSTLDGAREVLLLDTTYPAKLKFLSLGALVAIIQSVFLAMPAKAGK